MLLKIPATRTPQGALKFVALIIKILSCNKKKYFHGLRSKLPQMFDYALQITFQLGPVEIVNFFVNGMAFHPKQQQKLTISTGPSRIVICNAFYFSVLAAKNI
jgi:hypothetical protein